METVATRLDGKAFRRALGKNGKYIRTPKNDPDSLALMDTHGVGYSTTGLVAQMRANGNRWQHKDVSIKLAQVLEFMLHFPWMYESYASVEKGSFTVLV